MLLFLLVTFKTKQFYTLVEIVFQEPQAKTVFQEPQAKTVFQEPQAKTVLSYNIDRRICLALHRLRCNLRGQLPRRPAIYRRLQLDL